MQKTDPTISEKLTLPLVVAVTLYAMGAVGYYLLNSRAVLFDFLIIGTLLFAGLTIFNSVKTKYRQLVRKIILILLGTYVLVVMSFLREQNYQIEGVFLNIIVGSMGGVLLHYLVAKIGGPLVFGRGWCGWGCWTAMFLDILPFSRPKARTGTGLGRLRYAHFFGSIVFCVGFWLVSDAAHLKFFGTEAELTWLIVGNVLYFAVAITIAIVMRDNRAFCKYICPIAVPMKLTSGFSLMKVKGEKRLCSGCGDCVKTCPMNILITDYVMAGKRVESTECILCESCIDSCANGALKVTLK